MLPATFDQLRPRWYAMQAIACVDTAIWDAVGKAVGQPLWRLWGGYRDRVPMIGIGGYYVPERRLREGQRDRGRDRLLPARARHGRDEVQDRRRAARGGRGPTRAVRASTPATTSCSWSMPTRATRSPRRSSSSARSAPRASSCAGSRSPRAGTATSGRCATSGCAATSTSPPGSPSIAGSGCAR